MDIQGLMQDNAARMNALYAGADQSARYSALADAFRANFGHDPEKFISSPGRIEVVGNHTDHNHGRVLAASVNLDTLAAVAANGTDIVKLYSAGYDKAFVVDVSKLDVRESEKNTTFSLIRGVAARLKELGYKIGGFDAQVTSTVLKGSGLSSSAAFEVMLVAAFDALFNGWTIDAQLKAGISQYTENVYFGKPSGLMDQMACAVGGLVTIDFGTPEAKVEALSYDFGAKGYSVCVVAAGGEHGDRRGAGRARRRLGVRTMDPGLRPPRSAVRRAAALPHHGVRVDVQGLHRLSARRRGRRGARVPSVRHVRVRPPGLNAAPRGPGARALLQQSHHRVAQPRGPERRRVQLHLRHHPVDVSHRHARAVRRLGPREPRV